MKKLISITLALAMILSCMCIPAIGAEVETSTADALKAASVNGADHSKAAVGGSYLLIAGSSAWAYGRKTLITYDLSAYDAENLPDRFYLQIGSSLADTIDVLKDGEFVIEVFETTDNSTYDFATATYANTFDDGSIVKGDVIAELTPANGIELTASDTSYYGLRTDITKSIKEHIINGDSTVTYLLAVDPARGMKKADGTAVTYLGMNFATPTFGSWAGTQQLRPKLITADIPEEDINTVKSVKVTNGLLTEEFDPEALDDEENLIKTYEIAVINESADVSISYELTTSRSYVEGEVTTGNLEFGPEVLSVPVYSESGILRTYNFKLVKMDEETKESFAGYVVSESTAVVCPGNSTFQGEDNSSTYRGGAASTYFKIYEYPANGANAKYGRVALQRYDLNEIPAGATDIKVSISMNHGTDNAYSNPWLNNDFEIGVYALPESYMKWGWVVAEDGSRSIAFSDVFTINPGSSVTLREDATKLGTVNAPEDIKEIVSDEYTSVMANGVRAELDVTNYVAAIKAENPDQKYVTFMFGIDNWDYTAEGAPSTFGINFRGEKFVGGTNYDNYDEFRPRLDWYDFGLESENGIENIEVTNGILVDEFEPYAVDDYATLTKTYKIAVLDTASDVSVSYNLISEKSSDEGAVTTGNLEFGPEIITVPVTSESGVTRTYNFELVSFADAGLQLAYPTLDYAFRASNPFVAKDTDMLYLYGNTNLTDGSKFDGGAVKIYSPNFAEKKAALDDKTLAYADANGKFGLQIKANVKSLGNTLMVVPSYKYLGKELDGEEYIIKADETGAAATIGKIGDVMQNNAVVNNSKVSYSLKETSIQNGSGAADVFSASYPGALRMSAWASNAPNYNARRVNVLQFALSDDMLDAEKIELSFGMNSALFANSKSNSKELVQALIDNGITLKVSEVTNLNNTWGYMADRAALLSEGEANISRTAITSFKITSDNLTFLNYNDDGSVSSHHGAGYVIRDGGAELTSYIKNQIKAGKKLINLAIEVEEIEKFNTEGNENVQSFMLYGAGAHAVSGTYAGGKTYLEPFLASLRWE